MNEIKTNYRPGRCEYPFCNGEDKKGWYMKLKKDCRETVKEFYERLASQGWSRIAFYEVSTRVRGHHDVIAYVK